MITIITIGLLVLAVFALGLGCLFQKVDIEDLKLQRDRMNELYRLESDRNIEKLKEEIFRDDKDEILLNTRGL